MASDNMLTPYPLQLTALEKEVKEHSKKDSQKEQQEAEAPIINPGGFGDRLLLTQGNGYVNLCSSALSPYLTISLRFAGQAPMMVNGTGVMGMAPVSISKVMHNYVSFDPTVL